MIRLFKVKEKQKEVAENNTGDAPVKKQCAGELRLHKEMEPNHEDPLNRDAAELLRDNPDYFETSVRMALQDGFIGDGYFKPDI